MSGPFPRMVIQRSAVHAPGAHPLLLFSFVVF